MDNITQISFELNTTAMKPEDSGTMSTSFGAGEGDAVGLERREFMSDERELHLYLRVTCLVFFFLIFTIGVVGNIMVGLVITFSRDMRTSTNTFLVNLSIADLLVLVVCTPTAVIEVVHHPDRWVLGYYLCKFVPLLETTVSTASVLTILALSLERFVVICKPLRANIICTKSRAVAICGAAWVIAAFITSPMVLMIHFAEGVNERQEPTARCLVSAGTFWPDTYTITTIILFFLLPFFILLVTYGMIARRLTMDRSNLNVKNENYKNRKQVVIMLGSVCVTFFLCLLPFRVLTLFVLLADNEVLSKYAEIYHYFVYWSRIMVYLNSCLNPILYNVMSSKFRSGFLRLCLRHRKPSRFTRTGTFLTNTTATNSTNLSIHIGHPSGLSGNNSPEQNGSPLLRKNGLDRGDAKTLKSCLLSQSHNTTSSSSTPAFLLSNRPSGSCYNGIGMMGGSSHSYYPFHETSKTSFLRNKTGIKALPPPSDLPSKRYNTDYDYTTAQFTGPVAIKSDVVYSAYIPGKRSETVL